MRIPENDWEDDIFNSGELEDPDFYSIDKIAREFEDSEIAERWDFDAQGPQVGIWDDFNAPI